MNEKIALPYRQGDPRWSGMLLGGARTENGKLLTMASHGCYTAVTAAVLAGTFQKKGPDKVSPLTPGDLCTMLNAIGGYQDGQVAWWAVKRLFPDCQMWAGAWTTELRGGNFLKVEIGVALDRLKEALRMGLGVGVCVDAVPADGVKPDHIIALVNAPNEINEWMVMDPITGTFSRFVDRYGDPRSGVYGYRIFSGPPTEFPPYAGDDDQDSGSAFWKAVEVSEGRFIQTYGREISETLLFSRQ